MCLKNINLEKVLKQSIVPFQAGDYRKLTDAIIILHEVAANYWEKGNDSQASWIAERAKELTAHRDQYAALLTFCATPPSERTPQAGRGT